MSAKMRLLAGTVLALPIAWAVPAAAQQVDGPYVSLGLGANFLQNESVKGFGLPNGTGTLGSSSVRFDTGFTGLAAIGYGLGNGLRIELEGDYRTNDLASIRPLGGGRGSEEVYGAMVNLMYDVDVSPYGISFIQPYVGVGGGWMQSNYNGIVAGGNGQFLAVDKAVNTAAVQGIVGTLLQLPFELPGVQFTLEYRAMWLPDDRKYGAVYTPGAGQDPIFGRLKVGDQISHSVLLGVRYAFNQPPPPPPPAPTPAPVAAPAPAPSRTYLVFFDWDRADLTDRARQIISEAAQNSTRVQVTRIEVSGHADRTGTARYNQALSERRAQAVGAELVRDGVPQNVITVQGFGDTRPLVPTAAGVREPQNRRVEIVLR